MKVIYLYVLFFTFLQTKNLKKNINLIDFETLISSQLLDRTWLYANRLVSISGHQ